MCSMAEARFGRRGPRDPDRARAGRQARVETTSGDRWAGSTLPPGALSATARWISFFSCRTLPGHQYCENTSSVSELRWMSGLPSRFDRFAQEERAQVRNLFAPLAQRRHVDPDHAQAVVEVLAKLSFRHALLEIGVGRRQHAHVDPLRLASRRSA